VADHIKKLLVAPDIVLQRRDIQITHQHRALAGATRGEPVRGFRDKIQLVREFRIGHGIGNVATRGHVKIVQLHRSATRLDGDLQMPAIAARAPVRRILNRQRQTR
jgi:hypothetical protein